LWQDELLDFVWNRANEISVDAGRVFVAGWSVVAAGNRVLVAGEALGSSAMMIVRAHDAADGTVLWEDEIPNAQNFAEEHCIGADGDLMFVCGSFPGDGFTDDLFVRAYDIRTGQVRWTDTGDDGGRLSQASALTVSGGRLFVAAYLGCSPTTFDECLLTVRAYDPKSGALLWNQINRSPGNDWFVNTIVATAEGVFVGEQLNVAGYYEPTILSFDARSGTPIGGDKLDVGAAPIFTSAIGRLAIQGNSLIAAGSMVEWKRIQFRYARPRVSNSSVVKGRSGFDSEWAAGRERPARRGTLPAGRYHKQPCWKASETCIQTSDSWGGIAKGNLQPGGKMQRQNAGLG
jgi:hypothetical protein